jgi:hypothetical protein
MILAYKDQEIQQRDKDNFVNLTQMAKANGVRTADWLETKSAKEYLEALQQSISANINAGNGTNDKLIVVMGFGIEKATWAHPLVSLRFEQWIKEKNRRVKSVLGDIYILVDNGNNAYKIGFTTNLKEREKQHKTSNPFLELIEFYPLQKIENEQILHEKLRKYQIKGTTEWYLKRPQVLRIVNLILNDQDIE